MSEEKKGCQKPERLKDAPGECSPEQVEECHGDTKKHPCVPGEGARQEGI